MHDSDQTYTVETQTPLYTTDWYVKWASSLVILFAVMCRSVDEIPKSWDLHLSFIGTIGWFYVGMIWNDRAIIMLNGVLVFVLGAGILRFWL